MLSKEIEKAYLQLMQELERFPLEERVKKQFDGTGGKVSVLDLIAYQVGWGECVIRWYDEGVRGIMPEMPGEGFTKWDYKGLAEHFYLKYQGSALLDHFRQVAQRVIEIVEYEEKTGNLDQPGVWPWCILKSGKKWPLSKWIRVNTVAPYQRALRILRSQNKS